MLLIGTKKFPVQKIPALYKDYRTGDEATVFEESVAILKEKAHRILKLNAEKKAIQENMDELAEKMQALKDRHDFAARELEEERLGC
tara:strand:- start:11161 stop:11421 length:261 start_codon:yes stop_codon:yes gene_type:complete